MRIGRGLRGKAVPARVWSTRRGAWMLAALGMLFTAAACYRNVPPETEGEPVPPTILRVENQAFLDMNIYLVQSSQRIRLGTATGNTTTKFTIPKGLIFGATSLAFYAD